MRKFVFGSLAAVALTSGAIAADVPGARMAPTAPPPVLNWGGCYIGGNAGYKWGRSTDSVATRAVSGAAIPGIAAPISFGFDAINLDSRDVNSGLAGGQAGCRWESPEHTVIGVEGDYDWNNLHSTSININPRGFGGTVFIPGDFFGNRAREQWSARGVLGQAWNSWLVYATGGVAFTRITMTANFIPTVTAGVPFPASAASSSRTATGLTVGAGVMYALTRNWELGAEYRFTSYQRSILSLGSVAGVCAFTAAVPGGVGCVNTTVTGRKLLQTHEVMVKLDYKFDWGWGSGWGH